MINSKLKFASMQFKWSPHVIFAALCLAALLAISLERPPHVASSDTPLTNFSAERARRHLNTIARAPHPIGSIQAQVVREYLVGELRAVGLDPQIQQTTAINLGWGAPYRTGTVNNVIARLPGTSNSRAIMLVSHYDSAIHSYGAADAGAGVVSILETLRALRAGQSLRNDLIILFTDGEESGLLGAEAFVKEHPWAADIGLVLNLEARGSTGPSLMFETSDGNGWLINELAKSAPHPVASSLFYEIYRLLPNDTDLTIFKRAGMSGFNFAFIDGVVNYHSLNDKIENLDMRSLQHHGSYALALTRHFGNLSFEQRKTNNAIYFNFLGTNFIHYSTWWSIPLLSIVVLLFVIVCLRGFKQNRINLRGMLSGFLFLFTSILVSAIFITLLWWLIGKVHPQYSAQLTGDTYNSKIYFLAFTSMVLAIFTMLYNLFSRRSNVESLLLGGLLWWLVLAVLTSLFMTGASYLFVWPILFTLAGLGYMFSVPEGKDGDQPRIILVHCVTSALCVLLIAPVIRLLFTALTISSAGIVSTFVVLLVGLLLPLIDACKVENKWLLTSISGILALGGIIMGSLTATVDQARPRPSTIFYCKDADSGHSKWIGINAYKDRWVSNFFNSKVEYGAPVECIPYSSYTFTKSPATDITEPVPVAELLDDNRKNDTRTLRFRISTARKANLISAFLDSGVIVRKAMINDKLLPSISDNNSKLPWGVIYYAPPTEGFILTLEVASVKDSKLRIKVVDQVAILPVTPKLTYNARPSESIPSIYALGDSTLIAKSYIF